MSDRVSLAELSIAGLTPRPAEAAAIVQEICRQHGRGELPGIPSPQVVRLTSDGRVIAEGPIRPAQPPVPRAAQLLSDLLPRLDASAPYRVPAGLRLIVGRALGTIDLPPFISLEEFAAALDRFAARDLAAAVRSIFRAWECSREPPSVTISDVRRARRATGLSLEDISSASGISVALLRDLEWGDLRRWRNDEAGRALAVRYARASGLDEQLVLSVVEPLIAETAGAPPDEDVAASVALVPSGPQMMVPAIAPPVRRRGTPLSAWSLAVASVVLLAIALTSTLWRPEPPVAVQSPPAATVIDRRPAPATPVQAVRPSVRPVKSAASRRAPAKKTPFLKRELFRIVIR
jgi:Helix-turn-helix domain